MRTAQQARIMQSAMQPRLSPAEALEAKELAWRLCKLLNTPGNAANAAVAYQRTLAMIEGLSE